MGNKSSTSSSRVRRALVIGINYRNDPQLQLSGCIHDARSTVSFLKNQGYRSSEIKVLTDHVGAKSSQLPTKRNIIEGLHWLIAKGGDMYLHYSGHAQQRPDINDDELDGKDELIIPLDSDTIISDDWLRKYVVDKLRPQDKLWAVMDCCHSGTIMDLPYSIAGSNQLKVYGKVPETKAQVVCLSASLDRELAADAKGGAMTTAYLQSYKPGITHLELIESIRSQLITMGFTFQTPTLSYGRYENPETVTVW